MSDAGGRSALVVVASDAEPVVGGWRRRFDGESVARGITPHVTILFPFVPATVVDDRVLETLRGLYAPMRPFAYALGSVEAFPGTAWLAPEPPGPFLDLVAAARRAFPAFPPYGDAQRTVVPHCTVGSDEDGGRADGMLGELREGLGPLLPIRCRAEEVVLLVERPSRSWARHAAFPFEGRE